MGSISGRLPIGQPVTVTGTGSPQVVYAAPCALMGYLSISGLGITPTMTVFNNALGSALNAVVNSLGISLASGWQELPLEFNQGLSVTLPAGSSVLFSITPL